MDGWMRERVDEWMSEWMNEVELGWVGVFQQVGGFGFCTGGWVNGWMCEQVDEFEIDLVGGFDRMGDFEVERADEWINE